MATWSLRLRPVWSFAPAGPASSVTRRSTAVWMSSSAGWNANAPDGQLRLDLVEGAEHGGGLVAVQQVAPHQPPHVGAGAGQVVGRQARRRRAG